MLGGFAWALYPGAPELAKGLSSPSPRPSPSRHSGACFRAEGAWHEHEPGRSVDAAEGGESHRGETGRAIAR